MNYYLGLDNGGTTTKAALYTKDGTEVGVASMSTAMLTPKPNFTERDMEEMWDANCSVIRNVIHETGVDPKDIRGVGICGHGKGLYLWGKDDRPVRNGIISTDNRAYKFPVKWAQDGTEEKTFKLADQHIMAAQPVCLLAWLKENEPENYANIKYVFECKDYVRFRLTGEARAEMTDYSGANLMNLNTRAYDRELLELFGIPEVFEALPPLCSAAEIAGKVTKEASEKSGLLEGTPVVGGMFDIDACALAVGMTDEEHLCMIAGTWSINEYIRKAPVLDGSVRFNSIFALPEYYLIEESSPTSAGNNEWFIRELLPELKAEVKQNGGSIYDTMNEYVSSIPETEFVPVFLPFLMASNVHPNAKASFVGMTMNHTRKHLARSIYEGIAFCHKMHTDRLLVSRETPFESVRLAGGAAKSPVWTQIFADVLQMPVETVSVNETGALGCAIAVAAAVGDYASIKEAADAMVTVTGRFEPDRSKKEIYEKKYNLYCKTIDCLDSLWDEMQEML